MILAALLLAVSTPASAAPADADTAAVERAAAALTRITEARVLKPESCEGEGAHTY